MMLRQAYKFLSSKYQTLFLEYKVDLRPRYGHGKPPHGELYTIINENRTSYKSFLQSFLKYSSAFDTIKKQADKADKTNPVWENDFLPALDIMTIYTFLAEIKPKKYIEVGSGNSTKVVFKAKKDNQLQTEIISIDPYPRSEIDHLANEIIREPFEGLNYDLIYNLGENDILFIDNSHRILPNSDSMVFFLEVLPKLKKGVIVQVHDIYIPYDYPQFMCDRFYSEQYGLMMYLLANPEKYKCIFPTYFVSEDKELSSIIAPLWDNQNLKNAERHGGSFWIQIQ